MGWRPDEVRAVSLSDFMACIEGWNEAHGGDAGGLDDGDRAELETLMRERG